MNLLLWTPLRQGDAATGKACASSFGSNSTFFYSVGFVALSFLASTQCSHPTPLLGRHLFCSSISTQGCLHPPCLGGISLPGSKPSARLQHGILQEVAHFDTNCWPQGWISRSTINQGEKATSYSGRSCKVKLLVVWNIFAFNTTIQFAPGAAGKGLGGASCLGAEFASSKDW